MAGQGRRRIIFGGDWNAEVVFARGEVGGSVGRFSNRTGNLRGEWLAAWAQHQGLQIANSFFDKRWEMVWTHQQKGRRRVIDYFLVEARHVRNVMDAGVANMLDLGSDHRTVKLVIDNGANAKKRRRPYRPSKSSSTVGWHPESAYEYCYELDRCLKAALLEGRMYWTGKSL